jgi:UDP-N-acetyl-2-amino-2-deoxyglucuronate dehydrogenase
MSNFALIGVAGFVAPRHLDAIQRTGNTLLAAVDPNDSVGILDRYFPQTRFFPEIERFDRFLEKMRRRSAEERIHYLTVCSPNYLHDAHVRLGLRVHAHVICEKPLVISPWNLDQLGELEREYGSRVFTVLQLRLHPALIEFRRHLAETGGRRVRVELTYVTRRGPWYLASWKGSPEKSGGLAMNIGIHFFDLLVWLFGGVRKNEVHLATPLKLAGALELEHADVSWFLSIDVRDLASGSVERGQAAYRSITVDGREIDFSEGFRDLHLNVYEDILRGGGFGIEDARTSIELVHRIRTSPIVRPGLEPHPMLERTARD